MDSKVIAVLLVALAAAVGGAAFVISNPGSPEPSVVPGGFMEEPTTNDDTNDEGQETVTPSDDSGSTSDANIDTGEDSGVTNDSDLTIEYVKGTADCYTVETVDGETVVTFSGITEKTSYSVSGTLNGCIVVDAGDYDFDLDLNGVTIITSKNVPITFTSGDEVSISAKKDTTNYIYDNRSEVPDEGISASVYSLCDLELKGKGKLVIVSDNNNGIHTKDDLSVKNLTLFVTCADNALKGNDSVTITSGTITLNALSGDGIKTSSTDTSSKGVQRGTVTINSDDGDTTLTIRSYNDGIDAAFDVVIEETGGNKLTIDIVSGIGASSEAGDGDGQFVMPENGDIDWSGVPNNGDGSFPGNGGTMPGDWSSMPNNGGTMPGNGGFPGNGGGMPNNGNGGFPGSSTFPGNGGTMPGNGTFPGNGGGMPGGFTEGNDHKASYSCKGIKAGNAIYIASGTVTIDSYDDGLHANNDDTMESGATPAGDVVISGGKITISTMDDGIHADNSLTISDGTVSITNSYEGLEGMFVTISGGDVSIISSDDGINATTSSNRSTTEGIITLSGGKLYIYALGDGIDSNSSASYSSINFCGADVIIVSTGMSTGGADSSIDAEGGYSYTAGVVLAIGSTGFMNEVTKVANWSDVATSKNASISQGSTVSVTVNGKVTASTVMPTSISNGLIVYLGSNEATITIS